jgi:XTP/dITP diphosphohydrolase
MQELVLASNNDHKLQEIRAILGDELRILSLADIGFSDELPETSGTIPGNAFQKAQTLYNLTGRNCFADDSGLEVAALGGLPGVDTAHFAGPERNAEANNRKLLQELGSETDRSATFITVISLIINNNHQQFRGEVKGRIALKIQGSGGFGYDPLFIPDGYLKTFAELPAEVKNSMSHRANAVLQLRDFLIRLSA